MDMEHHHKKKTKKHDRYSNEYKVMGVEFKMKIVGDGNCNVVIWLVAECQVQQLQGWLLVVNDSLGQQVREPDARLTEWQFVQSGRGPADADGGPRELPHFLFQQTLV